MSSFKNFASMLSGLQQQADGRGTIAGSPIEDFLSIAGYGDGGGGGGGGGGGCMIVNLTWDDDTSSYTSDKTFAEVHDALEGGTFVYAVDKSYGGCYMPTQLNSTEVVFSKLTAASDGLGGYLLTSDEETLLDTDLVSSNYKQFTLTLAS